MWELHVQNSASKRLKNIKACPNNAKCYKKLYDRLSTVCQELQTVIFNCLTNLLKIAFTYLNALTIISEAVEGI